MTWPPGDSKENCWWTPIVAGTCPMPGSCLDAPPARLEPQPPPGSKARRSCTLQFAAICWRTMGWGGGGGQSQHATSSNDTKGPRNANCARIWHPLSGTEIAEMGDGRTDNDNNNNADKNIGVLPETVNANHPCGTPQTAVDVIFDCSWGGRPVKLKVQHWLQAVSRR